MYYYLINIDGMKCGMCEAHVNDLIRKNFKECIKIKSNHKKKETSFKSKEELDLDTIKDVIEKSGYKVLDIRKEVD